MKLFKRSTLTLSPLKEIPFKLEKEMQQLFENNLGLITNLRLIRSQFSIKNYRIDTLAFNEESSSFVIIEYKRDKNYSVIDQGVSYLKLMLEYRDAFMVEFNETQKKQLKRAEIDWTQSKVIFVSPSFTDFQIQASDFKDLAIELWEIKQFDNSLVAINPIKKSKASPSIKELQPNDNSEISKITREFKVYTEEDHLQGKSDDIIELYETYKNAIQNLGDGIIAEPKKLYITFTQNKLIADIVIQKNNLKLYINYKNGKLDDPKKISEKVHNKSKWGSGYYVLEITNTDNLEYIMSLVKQAL
ncbi:hypothetical protein EGT74_17575 [Chitinophaga lutea]|uniref:DUF5655 domain-containing protein n=1 Tax=Chitinophaga lutea TaxID=2488634 RepID=A0A3N4PKV1_9BACT|nr:DUF5655 domain-containing protein [Chitinophaga lutea]RPE08836.1 hypothetical protein EGT74_17575 [Chitinophaga lutea]